MLFQQNVMRPLDICDLPFDDFCRFFVDGALLQRERGWLLFEAREPGCLKAICVAAEYAFFDDIDNLKMSAELIKGIHKRCSAKVTNLNSVDFTPGEYRKNISGFFIRYPTRQCLEDTEGILQRHREAKYDSDNHLAEVDKAYQQISKSAADEKEAEVAKALLQAKDFRGQTGAAIIIKNSAHVNTFENTFIKNFPNHKNIYDALASYQGEGVSFRAVSPHVIEQEMQYFIDQYNKDIVAARDNENKLKIIAEFIWEIDHIHPFRDCNTRTNMVLLNRLLRQHNLGVAMIEDPNRIETLGKKEWMDEVKRGIALARQVHLGATIKAGMADISHIPNADKLRFNAWSLRLYMLARLEKEKTPHQLLLALKAIIEKIDWPVKGLDFWKKSIMVGKQKKYVPDGVYYQFLEIQKAVENPKCSVAALAEIKKIATERVREASSNRDPFVAVYYDLLREDQAHLSLLSRVNEPVGDQKRELRNG